MFSMFSKRNFTFLLILIGILSGCKVCQRSRFYRFTGLVLSGNSPIRNARIYIAHCKELLNTTGASCGITNKKGEFDVVYEYKYGGLRFLYFLSIAPSYPKEIYLKVEKPGYRAFISKLDPKLLLSNSPSEVNELGEIYLVRRK
jgi:hypothetical protein